MTTLEQSIIRKKGESCVTIFIASSSAIVDTAVSKQKSPSNITNLVSLKTAVMYTSEFPQPPVDCVY